MARIEGIKIRLDNWARWSIQRTSGGLGFPRINILAASRGRSCSTDSVPINDCDASETDTAITALKSSHAHLHRVLVMHYIGNHPMSTIADRTGRALSTIKANMAQADAVLQAWFTEVSKAKRK